MLAACSFCGEFASPASGLVTGEGVAICRACARIAIASLDSESPGPTSFVLSDATVVAPDPRIPTILVSTHTSVVIRRGEIAHVGPDAELPARFRSLPSFDCNGRLVSPGFVDSGTWLLGSSHMSRPEPEMLVSRGIERLGAIARAGVTCVDIRVGGSKDPVLETLLLAAARSTGEAAPIQTVITWVVGAGVDTALLQQVLSPTAARLASHALIVGSVAANARRSAVAPMQPRLLADSVVDGSGWISVEYVGKGGGVDTITVLRPDILLHGGPLWSGIRPALASGFDPDGVELAGLGWAMLLAVELGGLSEEMSWWAATRGSALALGDETRGVVRPGAVADLVMFDAERPEEVVRRPGLLPRRVLVGGVELPE